MIKINVNLISPIKKVNYQINENFSAKELKLKDQYLILNLNLIGKENIISLNHL